MSNKPSTVKHSRSGQMSHRLVRLVAGAALGVSALTIAAPAMAINKPEPSGGCVAWEPVTSDSPPRGSHAPADCSSAPVLWQPPDPPVSADVGYSVDLSSAGLGALAGIALGGAGLGIALGVQRRRDRSA